MNRKDKILRHITKDGRGIEIGPCHNPVAPRNKGYDVQIIDHMSQEDLINKYKGQNINFKNIEEVDFVWQGQSYSELTKKNKYYDWIIASHMIEHTPDLIGFLNDCDGILKDDGVVSLVVPDKRYCFDHYRPLTSISSIIDSHFQNRKIHSPGTIAEYYLNVVSKGGSISWNSSTAGEYSFIHSINAAAKRMNLAHNENEYFDVHAWCFVPHSFRLVIHDLFSLGLIPFQEVEYFSTEDCEFYITLGRNGKGIGKSRLQMLAAMESEIREETVPRKTIKAMSKNIVKRLINRFTWIRLLAARIIYR